MDGFRVYDIRQIANQVTLRSLAFLAEKPVRGPSSILFRFSFSPLRTHKADK